MKQMQKDKITNAIIDKQKKILVVSVFFVITLFISSSFALLTSFDQTEEVIVFSTGNLHMTINNTDGLVNLSNKLPINDEIGLEEAIPITLILSNTGTILIDGYEISLVSDIEKESTLV